MRSILNEPPLGLYCFYPSDTFSHIIGLRDYENCCPHYRLIFNMSLFLWYLVRPWYWNRFHLRTAYCKLLKERNSYLLDDGIKICDINTRQEKTK